MIRSRRELDRHDRVGEPDAVGATRLGEGAFSPAKYISLEQLAGNEGRLPPELYFTLGALGCSSIPYGNRIGRGKSSLTHPIALVRFVGVGGVFPLECISLEQSAGNKGRLPPELYFTPRGSRAAPRSPTEILVAREIFLLHIPFSYSICWW